MILNPKAPLPWHRYGPVIEDFVAGLLSEKDAAGQQVLVARLVELLKVCRG